MRTPDVGRVRRARALRRALSPPELKLWLELKHGSAGRCPFRNQHPIGPYIVDFYAPRAKLCVEVDGFVHSTEDHGVRDERRDAWLTSQGIEVVRYPAGEVIRDAAEIADGLLRLAADRTGR